MSQEKIERVLLRRNGWSSGYHIYKEIKSELKGRKGKDKLVFVANWR